MLEFQQTKQHAQLTMWVYYFTFELMGELDCLIYVLNLVVDLGFFNV